MVYASFLEDRAVIALSGAETRDFLQGLITNEMEACGDGRAIYAALLTPQGKILFDFFVVPHGEKSWLIDCAGSRASDLIKRLTLYRLRAKIDIAGRPDLAGDFAAATRLEIPRRPRDARPQVKHPAAAVRASGGLCSCRLRGVPQDL